ncbi:hypothetical protein ABIA33_005116 [Streptacidiphilus sp. MAP12-16]|uniref:hypothetical protein n=1 Tax=Streptacidiphilus sp. MAP12-16 TaxID=3156300 RepID=UPI00351985EC
MLDVTPCEDQADEACTESGARPRRSMWDLKRQVTAKLENEQVPEAVLQGARREYRDRCQDYLRALPMLFELAADPAIRRHIVTLTFYP